MGTSFIECTAKSASSLRIAVSSSLTNSPLPPILASGESSNWSPRLTMGTRLTCTEGSSCSRRALTYSACHRAKALLRVAIRRCRVMGFSFKTNLHDTRCLCGHPCERASHSPHRRSIKRRTPGTWRRLTVKVSPSRSLRHSSKWPMAVRCRHSMR